MDVRTVPASRRVPHFAKAALERALRERGIDYLHMPELGGLRKSDRDSINLGWRNASFRGYADYMQTAEFWSALGELERLAASRRVAIMCAEAVPWRCHRSLVADALIARGDDVLDIMGPGKGTAHKPTPWARVQGGRVTYPGPPPPRERVRRGRP